VCSTCHPTLQRSVAISCVFFAEVNAFGTAEDLDGGIIDGLRADRYRSATDYLGTDRMKGIKRRPLDERAFQPDVYITGRINACVSSRYSSPGRSMRTYIVDQCRDHSINRKRYFQTSRYPRASVPSQRYGMWNVCVRVRLPLIG